MAADVRSVLLGALAVSLIGAPVKADECDAVVGALIAQTPGLEVVKRDHAKLQDAAVDTVVLKHPDVEELSILCPVADLQSYPVLNGDVLKPFPPPAYFKLLAHLASGMTGESADAIRADLLKCHKQALAAKMGDATIFESNGITFDCTANATDLGTGTTTFTLAKHTVKR